MPVKQHGKNYDFIKKSLEEVIEHPDAESSKGLSNEEVKKRRKKYGPNRLEEEEGNTILPFLEFPGTYTLEA